MRTGIVALAAVAMLFAGCSSDPPPPKLKHGVLTAGSAHLTIDDEDVGPPGSVHCADVGTATTIRTGDDDSGVAVLLNPAAKLTVIFVRIRNLESFTGDYGIGRGDDAAATVIDGTFHINGTAFGYTADSIAPSTHRFAFEAAC